MLASNGFERKLKLDMLIMGQFLDARGASFEEQEYVDSS